MRSMTNGGSSSIAMGTLLLCCGMRGCNDDFVVDVDDALTFKM